MKLADWAEFPASDARWQRNTAVFTPQWDCGNCELDTPVHARVLRPTSLVGVLTSPRIAGLRESKGQKYPTTQWPTIIEVDTLERLVRLFVDRPAASTWSAPRRI